jgi:hypothetical protein
MNRLLTIVAAIVLVCVDAASAAGNYVVAPHSSVAGKTLGEHGSAWWQWALSIPLDESPVKDTTGVKCAVGQGGNVWFLAGTYESTPIRRRCTIPHGKYIFFPVINMVYWPSGERAVSCDAVKQSAALNNDNLALIEIEVDGTRVPTPRDHREASAVCFDVFARIPKDVTRPPGYPAASDGYWIMLKPLPTGKHRIHFRAAYDRPDGAAGDLRQDVSYEITVTAP